MEYVAGTTLEEVIRKEGAIPWQRALAWTAQIREGIAHARAGPAAARTVQVSMSFGYSSFAYRDGVAAGERAFPESRPRSRIDA